MRRKTRARGGGECPNFEDIKKFNLDLGSVRASVASIQNELHDCSSSSVKDYYYTVVFMKILHVLHSFIAYHRKGADVVTGSDSESTSIFAFDPTWQKIPNPENFSKKKRMTVIDNCFKILNEMMSTVGIREHIFPPQEMLLPTPIDDGIDQRIRDLRDAIDRVLDATDTSPDAVPGKPTRERYSNQYRDELEEIDRLSIRVDQLNTELDKPDLESKLINAYAKLQENLLGVVRVYVRLKGGEHTDKSTDIKGDSINVMCDNETKKYMKNDFTDVFDYQKTNYDIYNSLKGVFENLMLGKSVMIFGYGFSGSGKTYTLLNAKENEPPGIIVQFLQNKPKNVQVTIHDIFEIYLKIGKDGKVVPLKLPTENEAIGYDVSKVDVQNSPTWDAALKKANLAPEESKPTEITSENINKLITTLDAYRRDHDRIRTTINNPESSRSHLFIVFKVDTYGSETNTLQHSALLTVIDMAGREDPIDIIEKEYNIKYTGPENKMTSKTTLRTFAVGELVNTKSASSTVNNENWIKKPENMSYFFKYILVDDTTGKFKDFAAHLLTHMNGPSPDNKQKYKKMFGDMSIRENVKNKLVLIHKDPYLMKTFTDTFSSVVQQFYKTDKSLLQEFVAYVKNENERRSKLVYEGLIINETLNHISSYFRRRKFPTEIQPVQPIVTGHSIMDYYSRYKPNFVLRYPEQLLVKKVQNRRTVIDVSEQSVEEPYAILTPDRVFKIASKPNDETLSYSSYLLDDDDNLKDLKTFITIYNKDLQKTKVIPIMKQLGNSNTTYIMLCCARTEPSYCEGVVKTLDFARDVSSKNVGGNNTISFTLAK